MFFDQWRREFVMLELRGAQSACALSPMTASIGGKMSVALGRMAQPIPHLSHPMHALPGHTPYRLSRDYRFSRPTGEASQPHTFCGISQELFVRELLVRI
jgi:hypothetical protein